MSKTIVLLAALLALPACSGLPTTQSGSEIDRSHEARISKLEGQVQVLLGVAHPPQSTTRLQVKTEPRVIYYEPAAAQ